MEQEFDPSACRRAAFASRARLPCPRVRYFQRCPNLQTAAGKKSIEVGGGSRPVSSLNLPFSADPRKREKWLSTRWLYVWVGGRRRVINRPSCTRHSELPLFNAQHDSAVLICAPLKAVFPLNPRKGEKRLNFLHLNSQTDACWEANGKLQVHQK